MGDATTTENVLPNLKGFVILHLNVRSLLCHKEETFALLNGPDIICLSETWLRPKAEEPLISHGGYDIIRQDRV